MLFSEMRTMRGPNMWATAYNNLIVVRFEPSSFSKTDDQQQQLIREYLRMNYQVQPLFDDFNACMFSYCVQLASLLQGSALYHNLAFPSPNVVYGVLEYKYEMAGRTAFELASNIIEAIIANRTPVDLKSAIEQVDAISKKFAKGPTTSLIIDAATKRNIPVTDGPAGYTLLGHGIKQRRFSAAMSHHTTSIGVNIAGNKESTKKFLQNASLPVPKGNLITDENDLIAIAENLGFPLVTKPFNGNQGRNVTCNITDFESLLIGFRFAKQISRSVIVEKEIIGSDYRLLVIGNKFIAASLRLPAFVIGDGSLSINDLVDKENKDPRRGDGHENILTKIKLDAVAEACLEKQGFSTSSIPDIGKRVFLKLTANLSTGGTAEDVTDIIHPSNKQLAEKVSRVIGLDICGIDVMSPDITKPLVSNGGAIIEVNAAPGLRMHKYPSKGITREVGKPIIELMFENGDEGRIPIVAITGTNGKTTTTRLMAHVAAFSGYTVGFSSTDGIYVGGERIQRGDCSGPQSAKHILQDTTVDYAVFALGAE